jgi:hypothetical protein
VTGLVAGIGLRTVAGTLLGKAAGMGKGLLAWLGSLDAKDLIAIALALFALWQTFGRWYQHRHSVKVETQLSAAVGQLNAARADLATSQANEVKLRQAIAAQNASLEALSEKSVQQQQIAAKVLGAATERADAAYAVAQRLRASAAQRGSSAATGPVCEPNEAVKEQWQ